MPTGSSGSRVVYVIFSHRRPAQVERLVSRILALSPDGQVVLHHDGRRQPMVWSEPPGPRVHIVEPEPMDWGGFTMVTSTARMLEYVEEMLEYDWCAVISGQDYPARNLAAWEEELAASGADYILSAQEVNFDPRCRRRDLVEDEYYVRYAYRWRRLGRIPPQVVPVANRVAGLFGVGPVLLTRAFKGYHRLGVARSMPFGEDWRFFKGSQWMAMSKAAVRHILQVMDSRPELARYYATTLVPDESFFQSILRNAESLQQCDQRLTFIVWTGSRSAHPKVLGSADVPAALVSGSAFVRKLDIDVDPAALDALDRGTS